MVALIVTFFAWQAAFGGDARPANGTGAGTRDGVVHSVPVKSKTVAITFDDGPDPRPTAIVLGVLKKFNVRCTFFLIGAELSRYPDTGRQVVADGHEIGCHSYSHGVFRGLSEAAVNGDLERCEALFQRVLGVRPTLFRFPKLFYDRTSLRAVQERGYTVVGCSLDSYDWKIGDPRLLAQRVTSLIKPGDIVLMHDGGGRGLKKTEQALTEIFQWLQDNGYECVTVSELVRRGLAEAGQDRGPE